ncbi:unnamed protein product, partial [Rotaria magnacalcarata]
MPCSLVVQKIHSCKHCLCAVKMYMTLSSIPVNVIRSGLHLEHQLFSFFSKNSSDLLCKLCNRETIRHIDVLDWPPILIINVHDSMKNTKFRKPAGVVSLGQFSHWLAIGGPSSSVYDLTCFTSIIRSGSNDIMVRVTKTKQRWSTSINRKMIGDGEQLKRLYASSRILIFERVDYQHKFHFIQAIVKCSSDTCEFTHDSIPLCITLQQSCSIIENDNKFGELNDLLRAEIKSFYSCYLCHDKHESLFILVKQIFIFKTNVNNDIVGFPIVTRADNQAYPQECCSNCNCSIKNVELPVHKQIFIKCPIYLIYYADRSIRPKDLFEGDTTLTDINNFQHSYTPTSCLMISRYSDTIIIVKKESNKLLQYTGDAYSVAADLSYTKLNDILDTSRTIFIFYRQNLNETAQGKMKIVSRTDVDGATHLLIQD